MVGIADVGAICSSDVINNYVHVADVMLLGAKVFYG